MHTYTYTSDCKIVFAYPPQHSHIDTPTIPQGMGPCLPFRMGLMMFGEEFCITRQEIQWEEIGGRKREKTDGKGRGLGWETEGKGKMKEEWKERREIPLEERSGDGRYRL